MRFTDFFCFWLLLLSEREECWIFFESFPRFPLDCSRGKRVGDPSSIASSPLILQPAFFSSRNPRQKSQWRKRLKWVHFHLSMSSAKSRCKSWRQMCWGKSSVFSEHAYLLELLVWTSDFWVDWTVLLAHQLWTLLFSHLMHVFQTTLINGISFSVVSFCYIKFNGCI